MSTPQPTATVVPGSVKRRGSPSARKVTFRGDFQQTVGLLRVRRALCFASSPERRSLAAGTGRVSEGIAAAPRFPRHQNRSFTMPSVQMKQAPVCAAAALLLGSFCFARTANGQALVKVTPLGSHSGELCAQDRALLFEDPTGVRILYDQASRRTRPTRGSVMSTSFSCRTRIPITSALRERITEGARAPRRLEAPRTRVPMSPRSPRSRTRRS